MEHTRRRFLQVGGAAASGLLIGARAVPLAAGVSGGSRRSSSRAAQALRIRVEAAKRLYDVPSAPSLPNGDEARYPTRIASFTKGLPHGPLGEVEPRAYEALLRAVTSGEAGDFEAIPLGGMLRLVNPQASLSYVLEGHDPHTLAVPPAPAFDSAELAAEACELYWQALTRDVPFAHYDTDPLIAAAVTELSRLPGYRAVDAHTVFRGEAQGDLIGPYVSQFLWKEVPYGALRLVQQPRTATAGIDYLRTYDDWLAVQNGAPANARHGGAYRYISSARDLASYVHLDFSYQAFETACLVLFGMQGTTDAQRPYRGAPWDGANPYRGSQCQTGFVTFGVAHALDLVSRVAAAALRACWYQKWLVHRTLRPEELGGRVHQALAARARYPLHANLLDSAALDRVHRATGTWLLPQAYPEGAPLHPSYPSGHAAVAGACATVLKAFFDESFPIDDPVTASADGRSLLPYRGATLTVGGELDKLASNIAFGRNAAGIHWRSDAIAGLRLGEEVALGLLADMRHCWHEEFAGFSVTRFDGAVVVV
jgi:membrane-associated phospholipid phosphatase